MKTKSVLNPEMEVLSREQLSKIVGGRKVEVIIDGKKIIIELPDNAS